MTGVSKDAQRVQNTFTQNTSHEGFPGKKRRVGGANSQWAKSDVSQWAHMKDPLPHVQGGKDGVKKPGSVFSFQSRNSGRMGLLPSEGHCANTAENPSREPSETMADSDESRDNDLKLSEEDHALYPSPGEDALSDTRWEEPSSISVQPYSPPKVFGKRGR